jgi:hypothetical protein
LPPGSPAPFADSQTNSGQLIVNPWAPPPPVPPVGTEDRATRPLFKRKKVWIPAVVVAAFVLIGALGGGSDEPSPANASGTQASSSSTKQDTPTQTAADKRAAKKEAARQAAAEKRAAKQEAARQAAAEKRAAKQEAARQAAAAVTAGQENASQSADDYLSMTAFSRSGLIDQLKFEGYSTADATYGVDSQHANWNTQAARSAADYLDMTSFSRSGLIDQLMFEGYTRTQAEYGVNQTGL